MFAVSRPRGGFRGSRKAISQSGLPARASDRKGTRRNSTLSLHAGLPISPTSRSNRRRRCSQCPGLAAVSVVLEKQSRKAACRRGHQIGKAPGATPLFPYTPVFRSLQQAEVTAVADVRSVPASRRFPWFSKSNLAKRLAGEGIRSERHPAQLHSFPTRRSSDLSNKPK